LINEIRTFVVHVRVGGCHLRDLPLRSGKRAKCDEGEWGDGDPGGRRDEAPVRGKGREDACGSIDA